MTTLGLRPPARDAGPLRARSGREFLLRHRLGVGGMSEVYLAVEGGDAAVHRSVAVKRLRPELAGDERLVRLFRDEIRIASELHHPNVCAVLDSGDGDGGPFLVLEYLHGQTFAAVMARLLERASQLDFDADELCARVVCDAARGLHAAHEATAPDGTPLGVVHRDVSPRNVFVLHNGQTRVTDFGVAVGASRTAFTPAGNWRGTPAYMSPEQLAWQPTDRRADVFALGIVLWEATVGRSLFGGVGDDTAIRNVWGMAVPIPSSARVGYPAGLERIVLRALERDLGRRTPTAAEMADELEGFVASRGRRWGEAEVAAAMTALFGSD